MDGKAAPGGNSIGGMPATDDEIREKYLERAIRELNHFTRDLQFSLDGEADPWFEFDKASVDTRQFEPLRPISLPAS